MKNNLLAVVSGDDQEYLFKELASMGFSTGSVGIPNSFSSSLSMKLSSAPEYTREGTGID